MGVSNRYSTRNYILIMNFLASLVMVALCFVGACLTAPVEGDLGFSAPPSRMMGVSVPARRMKNGFDGDKIMKGPYHREGRDSASGFSLNPEVLNAATTFLQNALN